MATPNTTPQFVIDDDPVVWWPVTLRLPLDGGQFGEKCFQALIRVLSEERYVELLDNYEVAKGAQVRDVLADNAMRFVPHVAGWKLTNAAGGAVPFSVERLQALAVGPHGGPLAEGLWRAIAEVRFGERLGNSAPPPASGAAPAASES